jgi:hypothetical protein
MSIKREGPTLREITMQVLAELTAPAPVAEVVQRVLACFPSQSKDPPKRVRDLLHSFDLVGVELVYLDPKTIVPLRLAMPGVRFRVPLEPDEIKQGVLTIEPKFIPFLNIQYGEAWSNIEIELVEANDQPIPTRVVPVPIKRKTLDGNAVTREQAAFALKDWLPAHRARANDSVIVTILNWRPARLRFEFEPRAQYRKSAFAAQDRALADCIQTLLDESYDERIDTRSAILTAYARMSGARDYPGNPWLGVLIADPRYFVTDFDIKAGEGKSTLDFLRGGWAEPDEVTERTFTREQGAKVYRFTATRNYGKQKHVVEILGKHTFADFDDVMREAFNHDTFDHLSEFTRIILRGKGKKPREQHYGELNPFERTPAGKVRIAGLGLDIGAQLEYVYDFGDWIEHKIILESIGDAERGVKYPRVVK